MNNKGVSFIESLLTVVIIFTICGTLIPVSSHMKSTLYNKKLELHASETALEAAKQIRVENVSKGTHRIDHVDYFWSYDGVQLCVEFENLNGARIKCVNPKETAT